MARARNIKPSFFQNEELGELSPIARLAFIGMWTVADFKGCIEYRPKRLKIQILPYDECNLDEIVSALDKSGVIQTYSVGGQTYIKICNFEKHQNPHKNEREAGSEIPDLDENASKHNGFGVIEKNREQNGTAPADSLLLIPDSGTLIPSRCEAAAPPAPVPEKPKKSEPTPLQRASAATWAAYKDAYRERYHADPVRNEKVNGQVKQFVQRLGFDESPDVAAFFVSHNQQFYVSQMHAFGLALKDAEKLRTEWATGSAMTATRARQTDRTGSMLSIVEELKRERGEA